MKKRGEGGWGCSFERDYLSKIEGDMSLVTTNHGGGSKIWKDIFTLDGLAISLVTRSNKRGRGLIPISVRSSKDWLCPCHDHSGLFKDV